MIVDGRGGTHSGAQRPNPAWLSGRARFLNRVRKLDSCLGHPVSTPTGRLARAADDLLGGRLTRLHGALEVPLEIDGRVLAREVAVALSDASPSAPENFVYCPTFQ